MLIILIFSCKSAEEQQQCFISYINEVKGTPEYISISSAAKDSVSNWIKMDVKFFGHLDTDSKWKIDSAVFFNEDRSKALLLLLEIDTTPTAKLDYVKMLAAEKIEDHWYFYAASLPSIMFDRSENQKNYPYSFKELSELGQKGIIRRGYYKRGTCNLNYDYVNDWFKQPLAEYHQEFLYDRVE